MSLLIWPLARRPLKQRDERCGEAGLGEGRRSRKSTMKWERNRPRPRALRLPCRSRSSASAACAIVIFGAFDLEGSTEGVSEGSVMVRRLPAEGGGPDRATAQSVQILEVPT